MNTALLFLKYGLGLLPGIVLSIQTLQGDKAAGKDKLTMAQDMLDAALQGASDVLPAGSANAALAAAAASVASTILKATGAINAAVTHTKATGAYQAATAAAAANASAIAAAAPVPAAA